MLSLYCEAFHSVKISLKRIRQIISYHKLNSVVRVESLNSGRRNLPSKTTNVTVYRLVHNMFRYINCWGVVTNVTDRQTELYDSNGDAR